MLFDGFDMLFNIAFALIFCSVFIILAYGIITSITTWNKNNHSPRLNVSNERKSPIINILIMGT